MSLMRDWEAIKELLESDKIKQRAEGISRCREFLSSKRNFKALNENRNHSWLETLQTLFHIVIIERNASVSKNTAATDKRLDEAAQMVRWLAEKTHRFLSRKVVKALINHLTQMIAVNGKVQSFALTYAKALRTVLSYSPHLEHLDERQWTDITMLCFSAVLGDKVKIGQDFADSEAMDIDSEDDVQPRGALRAGSDDEFALPVVSKHGTANAVEIELLGCLEVVFRSNSSPFVTYAQAIFRKFLRFFRKFPSETTAHLAALVALNRALSELDLNDQSSMRRLGPHLWPQILSLWHTKNALLKEQILISLRYLFPFVIPHLHPHRSTTEPAVTARAKALYDAVLTEPTIRWRESYSLDLDHLSLEIAKDAEGSKKAFVGRTYRLGVGFEEKDAVAWSTAELGADALARIYEMTEPVKDRGDDGLSENARGKRRKVEDPLSLLLDSITDPALTSGPSVFRLQILLFLVDRHWRSLDQEAKQRILATVSQLLTSSSIDSQVQRWTLLVVAAISEKDCAVRTETFGRTGGAQPRTEIQDQIWTLVLRKVAVIETCRPACHAANLLLATDLVSLPAVAESIESFTRDLEIQGTNFPSDAVCVFLEWCLSIAASDARLFHLRFSDKLLSWLTSSWTPLEGVSRYHSFGQPRPHADPLSPSRLVLLIGRLTNASIEPDFTEPAYVPDCAVATQALNLSETARIRDFIEARVPPCANAEDPIISKFRTPASLTGTLGPSEDVAQVRQRRISAWLAKTLEGLIHEGDAGGETYWSNMSLDLARRHLDIATTALSVEGLFSLSSSNRSQSPALRNANTVITRLAPTLALRRWQPAERAYLLHGLDLIFAPVRQSEDIEYPVFLDAGPASGIPQSSIPPSQSNLTVAEFYSPRFILLRTIWKTPNTRETLEELLSALRFILGAVTQTDSSPASNGGLSQAPSTQASQRLREIEETQKKDDFEDVKVTSRTAQSLGPTTAHRAAQAYIAMCVRGFVSGEMALSGSNGPVRLTEVVEAITDSEQGEDGILVAEQAFKAVKCGLVSLGLAQCDSILSYLGNDLLTDYRYARDERFHLVTLRFLHCIATTWVKAEGPTEELGTFARQLCAFYINGLRKKVLASWKIRLLLLMLFDEYLRIDPALHYWKAGSVFVASEQGIVISPNNILPFMLADADFRVRFRASSSAPRLFQLYYELALPEQALFEDIKTNLTFNLSETEQVLTQVLAHANIMIVSASRRRGPYDLLLDIAAKNADLRESTIASLEAVSERLGLESLSVLYLEYARHLLWIWLSSTKLSEVPEGQQVGSDLVQQLPFRAAGFSSLRDARRSDFSRTASFLLQSDKTSEAFSTLCAAAKLSSQEGRLACLAETVAQAIIRHQIQLYYSPELPVTILRSDLQRFAEGAGAGDAHLADILLASIADDIVVETLIEMFQQSWPHDRLLPALEACDRTAAETFHAILRLPGDFGFDHEPPPPHYRPDEVVAAVALFSKEYSVFNEPAAVLSIVHKLLAKVRSSPFVLRQQGRLISLSVALALSHRVVNDTTVLEALGRGLVDLLPQVDLFPLVIPILSWSIERWFSSISSDRLKRGHQRALTEELIRAAHAATKLRATLGSDPTLDRFDNFLDDSLRRLCRLEEETATEACILWPRAVVETTSLSPSEIYLALASPFAPISKFAFVRALKGRKDILESPERGRILWRLAQALQTPEQHPSPEACLAFANLLFESDGRIEAPGIVEFNQDEVGAEDYESPTANEGGIQRMVVHRLLRLLTSQDRKIVSSAFDTAKLIMSVPTSRDHLLPSHFTSSLRPLVTLLSNPSLSRPQFLRQRAQRTLEELAKAEWTDCARDYDRWVRDFAELLADTRAETDKFYAQLIPLIRIDADFASSIVPNLVHSLLLQGIASEDRDVELNLSRYFDQLLRAKSTASQIISVVVRVASRLRRHPRPDPAVKVGARFDRWLGLSWTQLAEGAVTTGSYLDGLLYLELAHEYEDLFVVEPDGRARDRRKDEQAQSLLYKIYSNIDEPDGFYARESNDVRESLVSRYRHESRWSDAFGIYGARSEAPPRRSGVVDRASTAGVVSSLAAFGFNRLAMSVLQPARLEGTLHDNDIAADLPYELAWKSEVWDLPIETRAAKTSSASLYSALRSARSGRSIEVAQKSVTSALVAEIGKLSKVEVDLPSPDSNVISTILALREVHRLVDLSQVGSAERVHSLATLSSEFSFEQAEKILSTRISRLRTVRQQELLEAVGDAFDSPVYSSVRDQERACLIELSRVARRTGRLQVALNAVTSANSLLDDVETVEVDRELAHVLWAQGEHTTAITLLNEVHQRSGKKDATVWATLGEWTGEARLRNPIQVLEDCFDPAIAAVGPTTTPRDRAHVYQSFATFADAQYEELSRSTEEKRARFNAYYRRKTLEFEAMDRERMSGSGGNTLDSGHLAKSKGEAEAHLKEDRQQLEEAERTTRNMLQRALENYALALSESDESNDKVHRFCALWLAHSDDEELHARIKPLLSAIPSYKFVFLSYQLSARLSLSSRPSTSSKNIRRLVQRLCKEHVFHAFFPIHALRDMLPAGKGSRRSSTTNAAAKKEASKNSRAQAAAEVIESAKTDDKLRARITSLELASDAYEEWAMYDLKSNPQYVDVRGYVKKGPHKIVPSARLKSKLKNQPIPVSTLDLPIDPTGLYPDSSFPSLVGYDDHFDVPGGIHVPKIVTCVGSDGRRYRQLVKGDDEVRQDAVMEQIFTLVNDLLRQDVETRRRKLHIRTYKVIPLRNSTGLIEFVANTLPLGSSLQSLYDEMHPRLPQEARAAMRVIEGDKKRYDPEVVRKAKLETFQKTLQKMPPLMRHLFWKRQKIPALWFDMRLNYSRSVATTSMIGHVLGLGDRHVSNILIDEATGELVHIDFGIAFEQGKRLAIPELVPFRLTQNLVDGFGSSGVEGVFRRCSEETLRVLRERSNILMTILEVFKHDPLQRWAVSSEMAKRIQGSEDAEGLDDLPDDADRALSIVRNKLDARLSVQYSVNQVIQEATDPRNLSCIFSGWQPYF